MRIESVTLLTALLAAGCGARGPALHEPVGQTAAHRSPPPTATAHREGALTSDSADDVEAYVAGEGKGPCGMDPLPMIPFSFASNRLEEPRIVELRRLAGCLTAAPYETASVVLVGYTDLAGTQPANLTLGLERAQAVMRQLIEAGVSPGRIVVASAGELQRPRARWGLAADRVEVLVARGGPPRPDEAPIARGIDAEGLLPRSRPPAATSTTSAQRPSPPPVVARPPARSAAAASPWRR